ncbi:hypothetical protein K32_24440 [Kaistia sp. 32K]|uniref:hypothetical protein n=1 Tax=Kaistia sp. 32K TaxID=2795690 RepID=UPI0019154AD3|nr:hypothetical protein [Kaistia sp. 32K]BCP53827.1 hypothetical protein K32_24440 [Kaistia sp. 32K]
MVQGRAFAAVEIARRCNIIPLLMSADICAAVSADRSLLADPERLTAHLLGLGFTRGEIEFRLDPITRELRSAA